MSSLLYLISINCCFLPNRRIATFHATRPTPFFRASLESLQEQDRQRLNGSVGLPSPPAESNGARPNVKSSNGSPKSAMSGPGVPPPSTSQHLAHVAPHLSTSSRSQSPISPLSASPPNRSPALTAGPSSAGPLPPIHGQAPLHLGPLTIPGGVGGAGVPIPISPPLHAFTHPHLPFSGPPIAPIAPRPSEIQRQTKPKRLKAHTVTSKSYSIPTVPRDRHTSRPMLPLNVGIMTVVNLGEICMREHFHTERYIFPVGYEVTR